MKLKGRCDTGWAIFNHMGSPWSAAVFPERGAAEGCLDKQRAIWAREGWGDLGRHTVQPVNVTISPRPTTGAPDDR